jgi:lactate dehydrogenase-like 2-hydroxyacid dehydrogenase
VVVARQLLPAGLDLLAEHFDVRQLKLPLGQESEALELVQGAAAIVADPTFAVGPELLEAAGPELRVVANFAVGYDNVDLAACRDRGVTVTNTPDVLTNATAELALALTLAAARQIPAAERDVREGAWTGWDPAAYRGIELSGATFGVVGLGRIGRRYAELVEPLAGEILYAARAPKPEAEPEIGGAVRFAELDELLEASDVVSLHVPASGQTRHLIDERAIALMRPDAILVNTSRGALVDEGAVVAALRDGRLGAVGLDVYEREPGVSDELLAAPRAVLLPHIGSATVTARDAMARLAAENVIAVLQGGEPPNEVAA